MMTDLTSAFVFATPMEADPLIAMLAATLIASEPWPVYRIRSSDQPTIIVISGMGMASASAAVEFIVNHYAVDSIFNCGAAGCLTDEFNVGDLINVTDSWICKQGEIHADVCHLPPHSPGLDGWSDGVLLTVDRPVFDRHDKTKLTAIAQLVDMEGGIVARTCKRNNIPCRLIKIVSDHAVERDQLENNLYDVSVKLADRIMTDFDNLFSRELTA